MFLCHDFIHPYPIHWRNDVIYRFSVSMSRHSNVLISDATMRREKLAHRNVCSIVVIIAEEHRQWEKAITQCLSPFQPRWWVNIHGGTVLVCPVKRRSCSTDLSVQKNRPLSLYWPGQRACARKGREGARCGDSLSHHSDVCPNFFLITQCACVVIKNQQCIMISVYLNHGEGCYYTTHTCCMRNTMQHSNASTKTYRRCSEKPSSKL